MQIAIYGRVLHKSDLQDIRVLFDCCFKYKVEPILFHDYYLAIKDHIRFSRKIKTFKNHQDFVKEVECVISVGGDGTLLDTITFVQNSNIPIVGINIGRLGFLASTGREEIESTIYAIVNRVYSIDYRSLIHLDCNSPIFGSLNFALNEFSIHKKDSSSMIIIHTYINGELLNSYWADGLIVATPTGSTGYNLSCGGPIIFPTSENFVITPIAPHNLNVRPIIVSDNCILSFEIEGRNENFLCTLDSRYASIDSSYQLAIKKEKFKIGLLRINDTNFLQTLRNKLMWGVDKRN